MREGRVECFSAAARMVVQISPPPRKKRKNTKLIFSKIHPHMLEEGVECFSVAARMVVQISPSPRKKPKDAKFIFSKTHTCVKGRMLFCCRSYGGADWSATLCFLMDFCHYVFKNYHNLLFFEFFSFTNKTRQKN